MGDEKLKIAVLGPLGTYTHEASVFTNASYKIRLILPFPRQLLRDLVMTLCMMNSLQYQVSGLIVIVIVIILKNVFVA
jgi:hypothetical protein